MNVNVISYTLTGNNDKLAAALASRLSARHIKITESSPRTNGRIALDMLFNKTPVISPEKLDTTGIDLLLFVGPVWMGQPASPFRSIFKALKKTDTPYAFVSISGGALGPNPKLRRGLEKKTGRKPEAIMDLQIATLFLNESRPKTKDTSAYLISEEDALKLADRVMEEIGDILKA